MERAGVSHPLMALVIGLFAINAAQDENGLNEVAEVDAALLTDDLPLRHMPIQGSCNFEDRCCAQLTRFYLPPRPACKQNKPPRSPTRQPSCWLWCFGRHGGCERTGSAIRSSCAHAAACSAFKPVTKLRPAAATGLQPSGRSPKWPRAWLETLSTPQNWRSIRWQSDGLFERKSKAPLACAGTDL